MLTDIPSSSQNKESKTLKENRMEMVQTARQFLQNPRVQSTLITDQRKFLVDKGLTESEIDEAFKSLSIIQEVYYIEISYIFNIFFRQKIYLIQLYKMCHLSETAYLIQFIPLL